VWVGKHLSDVFSIRDGLYCHCSSSLLYSMLLEGVLANLVGLKLNGTHQLLVYADGVNILGGSVHTMKKSAEALEVAIK